MRQLKCAPTCSPISKSKIGWQRFLAVGRAFDEIAHLVLMTGVRANLRQLKCAPNFLSILEKWDSVWQPTGRYRLTGGTVPGLYFHNSFLQEEKKEDIDDDGCRLVLVLVHYLWGWLLSMSLTSIFFSSRVQCQRPTQIYAAANQSSSTWVVKNLVVALESSFPILSEGETCRFFDIPNGAGRILPAPFWYVLCRFYQRHFCIDLMQKWHFDCATSANRHFWITNIRVSSGPFQKLGCQWARIWVAIWCPDTLLLWRGFEGWGDNLVHDY